MNRHIKLLLHKSRDIEFRDMTSFLRDSDKTLSRATVSRGVIAMANAVKLKVE